MKILHTADLHIGKVVNGFSMIDDQKYILKQILEIIDEEAIETVLMSGDIYDKTIPSQEAVNLFNDFLAELYKKGLNILIISGNHDSADRLNFGQNIFKDANIYIESRFDGSIAKVSLKDEYGPLNVYMLPFLKPIHVNAFYDTDFKTYTDAIQYLIDQLDIDPNERNIMMAHQFVLAGSVEPETSESEVQSLGGLDDVSHLVFKDFDYTALGHIHKPQAMGAQNIRYSGSILKYSFSEAKISKSVTILDFKEKGQLDISQRILYPKKDLQILECYMEELENRTTYNQVAKDNYVLINLLDEDEVINAIGKARSAYPNVMQITFEKNKNRKIQDLQIGQEEIKTKSIDELFEDFFLERYQSELTESQTKIIDEVILELEEERQ